MAGSKAQSIADELGVEDLYQFLSVEPDASTKDITSAYRKKARKCHPDKNPDDPKAAEMFHKLSTALSILLDPAGKAAYDKWLKARHAAKRRHQELSAKRRKMKEALETKESQHSTNVAAEVAATTLMQKEIDRLREEGYRIMKEQEEKLRQEFLEQTGEEEGEEEEVAPTLKVTWKAKKSDVTNGGYSQALLEDFFSEFGPLHHVLVSRKRKGKALVAFHHPFDAQRAVEEVQGLPDNPVSVEWVSGKPRGGVVREDGAGVKGVPVTEGRGDGARVWVGGAGVRGVPVTEGRGDGAGVRGVPVTEERGDGVRVLGGGAGDGDRGLVSDTDYESITLMRLRQAEERKRLCQQIAREDSPR